MNQRWRLLASILLVSAMALSSDGIASADDISEREDRQGWNVREREELLRYARATWHSFELMAEPNGLPSDRLTQDDTGRGGRRS